MNSGEVSWGGGQFRIPGRSLRSAGASAAAILSSCGDHHSSRCSDDGGEMGSVVNDAAKKAGLGLNRSLGL